MRIDFYILAAENSKLVQTQLSLLARTIVVLDLRDSETAVALFVCLLLAL